MRVYIYAFVLLLVSVVYANAAVIFSDDYDNPGDTGWTCADGLRTGYTGQSACPSPETYGEVTHYAGEISTGGRTGNSYKYWRRNGTSWDITGGYLGNLSKFLTAEEYANNYTELYFRFYIKIPVDWDIDMGGAATTKFSRAHYGTSVDDTTYEVLFDVKGDTFRTGKLAITSIVGTWYTQDDLPTLGIIDGNWHCLEVRYKINSSTGGFQIWVDGVAVVVCDGIGQQCATDHAAMNTGNAVYFTKVIEPSLGNITDGNLAMATQGWYALEFDDFVVSTTYIGLDAGGDTTPPTTTITTSGPIASSTGSATIEGTATDDTTVTGVKCRIGAEPDASNGTACTGTTSWSCTVSGLASGENTVYCEAYDAAGNYDSGNTITANYTPPAANVNGIAVDGILWQ